MGDHAGRSPARKKPATAICSQPALDPCCLRAPFRRCGLAWTNGDGGRGSVPSFVGALSGGGDGDRSPCEELARRNVNGERSPILAHGRATNLEILRRRTSGCGCWRPSLPMILVTSQSTTWWRATLARWKRWVCSSVLKAIFLIGTT